MNEVSYLSNCHELIFPTDFVQSYAFENLCLLSCACTYSSDIACLLFVLPTTRS